LRRRLLIVDYVRRRLLVGLSLTLYLRRFTVLDHLSTLSDRSGLLATSFE